MAQHKQNSEASNIPVAVLMEQPQPFAVYEERFETPSATILYRLSASGRTNGAIAAGVFVRGPGKNGPGTGRWLVIPGRLFAWLAQQPKG